MLPMFQFAYFVVDSFDATATQSWRWSVTNKSNNSGRMSVHGSARWHLSLDRSLTPLVPDGHLTITPEVVSGGVVFPVTATVQCTLDTDEEQQEPKHEHDGMAGVTGQMTLAFRGTPGAETLELIWGDFRSFSSSLNPSPFGFVADEQLWTTTEPVAHLLRRTTFELAGGGVQCASPGKGASLGSDGFSSGGQFDWSARIALQPVDGGG
jgi:hypothetical protein